MEEHEDLIWSIIGKKGFCAFKYNSSNQNFCKNEFNLTGFCSRQSCPLANSNYATVIEKNGIIFLYLKKNLNSNFPSRNWSKISLSRNFIKAIQQIDLNLNLWPKFFINKVKLRLIKLNQVLIRTKIRNILTKKKVKNDPNLNLLTKKKEFKIIQKINFEKIIEHELLNRLHMGIYGENYKIKPIHYWKYIQNKNIKNIQDLNSKTILV